MKIAPFYGCQILRPSKILGFEDPDSPQSLEKIIEACGGTPIDYPAKLKCCGFPIVLAREEVALNEVTQPLAAGAASAAPTASSRRARCATSRSTRGSRKAEKQAGTKFDMPTLHMSPADRPRRRPRELRAQVPAPRHARGQEDPIVVTTFLVYGDSCSNNQTDTSRSRSTS